MLTVRACIHKHSIGSGLELAEKAWNIIDKYFPLHTLVNCGVTTNLIHIHNIKNKAET